MWSFLALVVAGLALWGTSRLAVQGLTYGVVGLLLAIAAVVLLGFTPRGAIAVPTAVVGGVGLGLLLSLLRRRGQPEPPLPPSRERGQPGLAVAAATSVLAVGLVLWVGANDPSIGWFGRTYSHGARDGAEVAITFDDGPDPTWTPAVREILDAHGVRGTFFQVGAALDAHPDVARGLLEGGHLLANHSYHHDYWRWLDPRYPELDRTQDSFRRQLGVCPALFRPPHGQRTPFMLAQVRHAGMSTVTWDVSAADWSDPAGERVASRIVDRARPGSIILLHDGLDGADDADRSVLRTALPLVIDGLEAKGLQPVRLDELLDLPGYLDC